MVHTLNRETVPRDAVDRGRARRKHARRPRATPGLHFAPEIMKTRFRSPDSEKLVFSGVIRCASAKSETKFLNQLSILFHKCQKRDLRFSGRAVENHMPPLNSRLKEKHLFPGKLGGLRAFHDPAYLRIT